MGSVVFGFFAILRGLKRSQPSQINIKNIKSKYSMYVSLSYGEIG